MYNQDLLYTHWRKRRKLALPFVNKSTQLDENKQIRSPLMHLTLEDLFHMQDANEVSFERWVTLTSILPPLPRSNAFVSRLGFYSALHNRYLIPTREMVECLGRHLANSLSSLSPTQRSAPILDLGGSVGDLALWLNRYGNLPSQVVPVDVVPPSKPTVEVIVMDQQEAVEKYQPSIVLSSWMPSGSDWTKGWRNVSSVCSICLPFFFTCKMITSRF